MPTSPPNFPIDITTGVMYTSKQMKKEFDYKLTNWDEGYSSDCCDLEWKCPSCGHKHPPIQYDLYEYFPHPNADIAELEVECEECKVKFFLQVIGEYSWDAYEFNFKKIESD